MQATEIMQNAYTKLFQNADSIKIIGPKALIIDSVTMKLISSCYTQNQISQDQVISTFTIEELPKITGTKFIQAIVLIQNTEHNMHLLTTSLAQKTQKFKQIHINFTQTLTPENISKIASSDKFSIIQTLRTLYLDFHPVFDNFVLATDETQILSLLQNLNRDTSISYISTSHRAKYMAERVQIRLPPPSGRPPLSLIFIDRDVDVVSALQPPLSFQAYVDHEFEPFQTGILGTKNGDLPFSAFSMTETSKKFLPLDQMTAIQQIPPLSKQLQVDMQMPNSSDPQVLSEAMLRQDAVRPILNEINTLSEIVAVFKRDYDFRLRQARIFATTRSTGDSAFLQSEIERAIISLDVLEGMNDEERDELVIDEALFCLSMIAACGEIKGVKQSILSYLEALTQFMPVLVERIHIQAKLQQSLHNPHKNVRQFAKELRMDLQVDFRRFRRPEFVALLEDSACKERARYYQQRPLVLEIAQLAVAGEITSETGFLGAETPENAFIVIYYIGGISPAECASLHSFEYYARFNDDEGNGTGYEVSRLTSSQVLLASDSVFNRKQYLMGKIPE